MNCDVDYVNKPEKYKCLENTIDGNIFNKHNDQGKKTLVKRIFFTCMEFIDIDQVQKVWSLPFLIQTLLALSLSGPISKIYS
jgi:hypothetical protein